MNYINEFSNPMIYTYIIQIFGFFLVIKGIETIYKKVKKGDENNKILNLATSIWFSSILISSFYLLQKFVIFRENELLKFATIDETLKEYNMRGIIVFFGFIVFYVILYYLNNISLIWLFSKRDTIIELKLNNINYFIFRSVLLLSSMYLLYPILEFFLILVNPYAGEVFYN